MFLLEWVTHLSHSLYTALSDLFPQPQIHPNYKGFALLKTLQRMFYQCCQKWSPLKGTLLAQTRELRDDCQPHWSQGLSTDSRAKAGWGNPRESPFLLFFLNHHGPVMLSEVS